jgi:hypothetical protein
MIRTALTAMAAALLATSAAQAEMIDFEALDGIYDFNPVTYQEDGFTIGWEPTSVFGFYFIDRPIENLGQCSPVCADSGSTAFYNFNEGAVTIALANGGLFDLASLQAAQTFTGNDRPLELTLTALAAAGTITTTLFADPDAAESFTTFLLDGFTGLTSLTITGSAAFPEFALDNLDVSPTADAAVPEPASWAMLIAGFGLTGGALRRRRVSVRYA